MVQKYDKKAIYKHKYRKIFINKKGVTFWATPFYLLLDFCLLSTLFDLFVVYVGDFAVFAAVAF